MSRSRNLTAHLHRGPVELLLQEMWAERSQHSAGFSQGTARTESWVGRLKLGCGVRNSLVAKLLGPHQSCWIPGWARWQQHLDVPFAGQPRPHGPQAAILGVDETLQEGQTKGQGCAKRDHVPKHPTQGSSSTHGTVPWDTLLGALSREGTAAPATWTTSSRDHMWDLEKPGPSVTSGIGPPVGSLPQGCRRGRGMLGMTLWRWLCHRALRSLPRKQGWAEWQDVARFGYKLGGGCVLPWPRAGMLCRGGGAGSGSAVVPHVSQQREETGSHFLPRRGGTSAAGGVGQGGRCGAGQEPSTPEVAEEGFSPPLLPPWGTRMEQPRGLVPSSHILPPSTQHPPASTQHPHPAPAWDFCIVPRPPPSLPAASQPTALLNGCHQMSPTNSPGTRGATQPTVPSHPCPVPGCGRLGPPTISGWVCCGVELGLTKYLKLRLVGGKAAPTLSSGTKRPFHITAPSAPGLQPGVGMELFWLSDTFFLFRM